MTWVKTSSGPAKVTRFNPKALVTGVLAVLVAGAMVAFVIRSTGLPERIERLTVENQTDFPLDVEVSRGEGEPWLGVGVVEPGDSAEFSNVIDQGVVWIFRFSGQGVTSSPHQFSRQEMVAGNWTVVIPRSVDDDMRASGVEPPP